MSQLLEEILSRDNMMRAYKRVVANKGASGVDGITTEEVKQYLVENWENIREQIRNRKYKPLPVRRVEIPKPNGGVRNLGIPSVVDRIIEQAIAQRLTPIVEPLFSDYSYGFRPKRKAQQAVIKLLEYLNDGYTYIVDIDLEKFFDNVPQDKLMYLVHGIIDDGDTESLIHKYLKAGVMIQGRYEATEKGTPQGGLISPVLANVYLHYVLDSWFENHVKPELKGKAYLVRFADDFILLFQYENEAKDVYERLVKRLEKFGLEVEQDKTHILPFGRYKGTNETFDFLGFTHYNGKTRTGKYTVGHKVSKKKKKVFRQKLKVWAKDNRVLPTDLFMKRLNVKFTSTIRFYAISGTMDEMRRLQYIAFDVVFKWINRRSQRRSYTKTEFGWLWNKYIDDPKIYNDIWLWNRTPLKV